MGKIMLNNVQYSGVLTDAANIIYRGSAGLSATTVQAALNELASIQVQSNWSETDTASKSYILNKPAIKSGSRNGSVMLGNGYVDNGTNLLAIGSGSGTAANLATVSANGSAWFKNGVYIGGNDESSGEQLITASSVASQYIAKTGTDDIEGSLIPFVASTYNLGSQSQTWENIYGNNLNSITVNSETGYIDTLTAINSVTTPIVDLQGAKITYDTTNERIVFSFD